MHAHQRVPIDSPSYILYILFAFLVTFTFRIYACLYVWMCVCVYYMSLSLHPFDLLQLSFVSYMPCPSHRRLIDDSPFTNEPSDAAGDKSRARACSLASLPFSASLVLFLPSFFLSISHDSGAYIFLYPPSSP